MTGLRRTLGPFDVTALTVNAVIGAGVLALPAKLAASAGALSFVVLAAAFVLIALMALCTIEVASRFDVTGGPMYYTDVTFGPAAGFAVGWLMWVSRLASFGAITTVLLDYASGLWPRLDDTGARAIAATVVIATLMVINLRGVSSAARLGNVLATAKVLSLLLIALAGAWFALRNGAHPPAGPATNVSEALLIALFACIGFESGPVVAGEVRNPRKNLTLGMLAGIAIIGALYALLVLACVATVPNLAASPRPLADAAAILFGPVGAPAMSVVALISCAGVLSVILLASSRLLYALAVQESLPPALAAVRTTTGVPYVAVLVTSLLFWILTLSGTFVYLATVSLIARLAGYAGTCAALLVLRQRAGVAPLPVRGGVPMAIVSLVSCVLVLTTSTGTALRDVTIALAIGMLLRFAYRRRGSQHRRRTRSVT